MESRETLEEFNSPHRPRYATLSDYLRLLRRQKWIILAATVLLAGAAAAFSLSQSKSYEASATVSFRDITQDVNFLGGDAASSVSPGELAARNSQLLTRPGIANRVKKNLKTDLTPGALSGSIRAEVGVRTNLVSITASSGDPKFAAKLANEFAAQARVVGTRELDARLDTAVDSLKQQIEDVKKQDGPLAPQSLSRNLLQQELGQLEVLRQVSEPVQVLEDATVPTVPVSPATRRNVVLGAILGLIVGFVLAFMRDSLDRRVRSAHDVYEESGLPVLGRVGNGVMGAAGLASEGSKRMDGTEFEPFRALRLNLGALSEEPPRSIVVTSGLPQEGKSTVSMSLASAAAIAGQRVLLVECDLRRPVFATRMKVERSPGLTDYLLGKATPQEILRTVSVGLPAQNGSGPSPTSNLFCIPAGTPAANPAELLISERFREFLDKVKRAYDFVVIDTSPMLAVVDPLEISPYVDAMLICVRLGQTTREQVRAVRGALSNIDRVPAGAVATGIKKSNAEAYDYYYYGSYEA